VTDFAEFVQASFGVVDLLDPLLGFAEATLQTIRERLQPWIHLQNTCAKVRGFLHGVSVCHAPVPSLGMPPDAGASSTELAEA